MTDDEIRKKKGMLLLECEESETDLANLIEKALRYADSLKAIGEFLHSQKLPSAHGSAMSDAKVYVGGKYVSFGSQRAKFEEVMNFGAVTSLVSQIENTRSRVAELHERKKALGLS